MVLGAHLAGMAPAQSGSSLLELEAAHYFKLDPGQLNFCSSRSQGPSLFGAEMSSTRFESAAGLGHHSNRHQRHSTRQHHRHHHRHHQRRQISGQQQQELHSTKKMRQNTSSDERWDAGTRLEFNLDPRGSAPSGRRKDPVANAPARAGERQALTRVEEVGLQRRQPGTRIKVSEAGPGLMAGREPIGTIAIAPIEQARSPRASKPPLSRTTTRQASCHKLNVGSTTLNGSSTTSTNSLPSISSSPSVSPSVVCPHLSLDDLLECRQGSRAVSPHTIGLCSRCRLDPPPNVHSPLSPMFKPYTYSGQRGRRPAAYRAHQSAGELRIAGQADGRRGRQQEPRRGGSNQQAARYTKSRSLSNLASGHAARNKTGARDDSLDFGLAPGDLRRLQMSPTMRNSVEYIRKNSIESGRVLKIYKNGEPFEKPLRVCVMRGEFANLDHFLDHINTRLLVALGARYLFHLDGQLVYSVQELKHGSSYIVSGTRCFDHRTGNHLREIQKKEQQPRTSRFAQEPRGAPSAELAGAERFRSKSHSRSPSRPASLQATVKVGRPAVTTKELEGALGGRSPGAERGEAQEQAVSCLADPGAGVASKFAGRQDARELDRLGEKPARMIRAKSELSVLPKKKKNVTFVDTGRGSSPAIGDIGQRAVAEDELLSRHELEEAGSVTRLSQAEPSKTDSEKPATRRLVSRPSLSTTAPRAGVSVSKSKIREFNKNDVGIQVSDSIGGFLIDLPMALPARGDDSNLGKKSRTSAHGRGTVTRATQAGGNKRRQVVTITERQLSLDELDKLKDLSQGDHHNELMIERACSEDAEEAAAEEAAVEADEVNFEAVPDRSNTIAIGSDPQVDMGTQTLPAKDEPVQLGDNRKLVTSSQLAGDSSTASEANWQYPGGRAASATPTERPVSQSGPSESVRARVTTPTPSLSTVGGDENSLSMSYEAISPGDGQRAPAIKTPREPPTKAPPKRRPEVGGTLCSGLYVPKRNFRLVWVNGFSINDLYPENSVGEQQLLELGGRGGGRTSPSSRSGSPSHLSPEYSRRRAAPGQPERQVAAAFKPSERYHNWICHSRRHNELIYPAGSLIVLWCQWSNEQRFYSRHTANVSAVALATLDLDLAASAQACELNERPAIGANVHLWSVSNLDTLMVVEEDQLRAKQIFSLRLKNTKSGGCELSVGARDEKQLYMFTFNRKLATGFDEDDEDAKQRQQQQADKSDRRRASREAQSVQAASLRSEKAIQSNQIPLFIMKVPHAADAIKPNSASNKQPAETKCEPVICFGRRCFQVWAPDLRQQKLRLMQPDGKSAAFASLMAKANCLCRLSPSELLVGDSDGNVALLAIKLPSAGSAPRTPIKSAPGQETRESKYVLETMALLGPLNSATDGTKLDTSAARPEASVTCLARVSGSLFMSADTSCTVRFWKIRQQSSALGEPSASSIPAIKLSRDSPSRSNGPLDCEQVASISLPPDLGFICTILLASYSRADSAVEFYIVSTCNTILRGSVKLPKARASVDAQQDLLANSTLSVVYEGHETSASSLVADFRLATRAQMILNKQPKDYFYFTCSLDCRICKWNGTRLVWKSMLPSSCVSLAVHPNGFVLAVGSIDGTVYILDKISGLLVSYFPLTPVRINCLAYSSDGSLLAAGCANGSIFILPVYERGLKYRKVSIFQVSVTITMADC